MAPGTILRGLLTSEEDWFESLPSPVILTDLHGNIFQANLPASQLLRLGDVPGLYCEAGGKTRPAPEWLRDQLELFARSEEEVHTFQKGILDSDGQPRDYEVRLARMLDVSQKFCAISVVMRDVTERHQARRQAERSGDDTNALLTAARALLDCRDFPTTARVIFDAAKGVTGATSGYVALLTTDGHENEVLFLDAGGQPCSVDPELPMPIRGLRAEAYRLRKAVCENRFATSRWVQFMPAGHMRLDNVLFAPLRHEHETVGLIGLANKPVDFTEHDVAMASAFGELAAVALHNARLLESLEQSEARFRQLFTEMHAGFALHEIICDEDGNPSDYRFLEVNAAFEQMTGLCREQILGKRVKEVLPGTEDYWITAYGQVARTGTPVRLEQFSNELDRFYEVVAFSPAKRQFAVVIQDVTSRVHGEEERRKLSTGIHQAAEAVVITDRTGAIEYVNPAWEAITGYSYDESIGNTPRMVKSGRHGVGFYADLWSTLLRGDVWKGRMTNRRKDGNLYEAEMTISPVRDRSGAITHFVSLKRDVTHETEMERRLRHAQKMEAIGALAGGIAHDFNNILQAILGYADIAHEDIPADTDARRCIEEIRKAGRRAAELVKQILAFGRPRETEIRPFHIEPIAKEVVVFLRQSIPANIQVRLNLAERDHAVVGDPAQLHQVLMNLATNAYHAMDQAGGILTIAVNPVSLNQPLATHDRVLDCGRYVCICVSDTGHGMDAETQRRIFEPYFTTKDKERGTGLGLATIYTIVSEMGGGIVVESTPGRGSSFNVYLPAATLCEEVGGESREERASTAEARGLSVLLVDDEEQLLSVTSKGLARLGYDVTAVGSAPEAVEYFSDPGTPCRFDVVITDFNMPNLSGTELAKHLKMLYPGLPVVLCTGCAERITDYQDMAGLLRKPYSIGELAQTIQAVAQGVKEEIPT